jgi:hypothetical protein
MKKNHIHYFGENLEIEELDGYKPKVYTSIESSGVGFTIWFACRLGLLRQLIDEYTFLTMDTLTENDFHLAYDTIRITDTVIDEISPKEYKEKVLNLSQNQNRLIQKGLIQVVSEDDDKSLQNHSQYFSQNHSQNTSQKTSQVSSQAKSSNITNSDIVDRIMKKTTQNKTQKTKVKK